MKIIETHFKFRNALSKRYITNYIILHHAAGNNLTVQQIHQEHLNNGWSGIGYHYYIRKDGSIYRGRPENTLGSHCKGSNFNSIGICCEGNYETIDKAMPAAQLASLQQLIQDIKKRYPKIKILGHKEKFPTACPGKNFPLLKLKVTYNK